MFTEHHLLDSKIQVLFGGKPKDVGDIVSSVISLQQVKLENEYQIHLVTVYWWAELLGCFDMPMVTKLSFCCFTAEWECNFLRVTVCTSNA